MLIEDTECQGSNTQKIDHIVLSEDKKTWEAARTYCKENDGQLWGDINGTIDQLYVSVLSIS